MYLFTLYQLVFCLHVNGSGLMESEEAVGSLELELQINVKCHE